ncbi:MAG: cupin domain-containing protein [Bacteroidia bacterium]|jgi:mannose-6-phosphate isomerase-like protein (cupin superfamily)|nr:cupin domain-containing protein [Bacteroidia bacterium]MBP7260171.1 cupin domain-containing protein [Bacteroidia bacterium]MBP9180911.1 cupin domain-containing protein [Bacteroidia bacterium]MBP9724800.1 cupin domain-containing protein [Bacteroidia bacterium]
MKTVFLIFFLMIAGCITVQAQSTEPITRKNLEAIKPPASFDGVYTERLWGDTLVTSFLMFIKGKLAVHYHDEHSEHVYVLDGTAEMTMDGRKFTIKKGDFIFIPMGARHSVNVTSPQPLKIISIQAPWFDGRDRIVVK